MMKITSLIAALFLALFASMANAATIWTPTNEDTDFITFEFLGIDLNGATLAMFDDSDIGSYAGPSLEIGTTGGEVRFTASGSDTLANSYDGSNNFVDGPLTLTGSSAFTLAITYDGGTTWLGDTSWEATASPDSYLIHFDGPGGESATIGIDLSPAVIPVPAATWLFVSGLLGMVGVARRRQF